MSIWTLITLASCAVILTLVLYLNLNCKYDQGPLRSIAFFAMSVGAASPLYEVGLADNEYDVLPTTAALASGMALFLVSHWMSFEVKYRKRKGAEDDDEGESE